MANFYGYSSQPFVFDKIVDVLPDIKSDKDIALGRYILVQEKDASGKVIGGIIYLKAYENNQYTWKLISYLPMSNSTITNINGGFKLIDGKDLGLQLSITTEGFAKQNDGTFIPIDNNTTSYDIDTNIMIDSDDIRLSQNGDDIKLQVDHAATADNYSTTGTIEASFKGINDKLTMMLEGDLVVGNASHASQAAVANNYSKEGDINKEFSAIRNEIKSHITIDPAYNEGNKIADIKLNEQSIEIYAPKTDFSNYYNKKEVDDKISNVEVDLSNYYTKTDINNTYLAIEDANKNYVLKSEVAGSITIEGFENNENIKKLLLRGPNNITYIVSNNTVFDTLPYGKYSLGVVDNISLIQEGEEIFYLDFNNDGRFNQQDSIYLSQITDVKTQDIYLNTYFKDQNGTKFDNWNDFCTTINYQVMFKDQSIYCYKMHVEYPILDINIGYQSHEIIDISTWVSYTLENNSWAKISEISQKGLATKYWNLGDTKTFVLNGITYTAKIIGFDHDMEKSITFILGEYAKDGTFYLDNRSPACLYEGEVTVGGMINDYGVYQGKYDEAFQEWLNKKIFKDAEFYNYLREVEKWYPDAEAGETLSSMQKVFIPSEKEITGKKSTSFDVIQGDYQDKQYMFYKINGFGTFLKKYTRKEKVYNVQGVETVPKRIMYRGIGQPSNGGNYSNLTTYALYYINNNTNSGSIKSASEYSVGSTMLLAPCWCI